MNYRKQTVCRDRTIIVDVIFGANEKNEVVAEYGKS